MISILGLITARGGSKGIPGKNIRELSGKPLIAYTIAAARESGVFDRVILSTDDEKIAAAARLHGCEAPFLRPAELARDTTPHLPVLQHAVRWLEDHEGYRPDWVMILQPTSPLRQAMHIIEAAAMMKNTDADSVVSVSLVPSHFHPQWQHVIDHQGRLGMFGSGSLADMPKQRQGFSATYARNGAIYLFKTALLFDVTAPGFYGKEVAAYVMDPKYSVNIDEPEDWDAAERAIARLRHDAL